MIAAHNGLPADALAFYSGRTFVILLNAGVPTRVRGWLADQLLGLIDPVAPDLTVRVPLGEAERMFGAPLADEVEWRSYASAR